MTLFVASILLLNPGASHAYLGPGLGAGAAAVALGLIGSVLLALFALLWYPIKKLVRRFRKENSSAG
jgi:hypothetical protein